MRLATILDGGRATIALVLDDRALPVASPEPGMDSMRAIAGGGVAVRHRIEAWAAAQPEAAYRSISELELGPAVTDPGAIYTIGHNYRAADEEPGAGPDRPMVYGKAATSVSGHGATVIWDRDLTANVDAECELGVVIGAAASAVPVERAMDHVFGYTCVNDISSRDPWLNGDQWLLGKSMPGFCPLGPWIVTADELAPDELRLGCTINGVAIQDGSTAQMRFPIPELIAYLSRHVTLSPGDVIATGTPARLNGPIGPDRHLQAGDVATVWIEGIGELTTIIA